MCVYVFVYVCVCVCLCLHVIMASESQEAYFWALYSIQSSMSHARII